MRICLRLLTLTVSAAFYVNAFTSLQLTSNLRKVAKTASLRMCAAKSVTASAIPFTQEMREKAMSLHTFSQAPKEGKLKDDSSNTQVEQWQTTKADFLQFLVDSKAVYEAFEKAVEKPNLQTFRKTGLERVRVLEQDIRFIQDSFGLVPQAPNSAATDYANYISGLSEQAFVTHFYNFYFAHTAGGRMIGKRVMDEVFGGHLFAFYTWDRDVKEMLAEVKGRIDALATGWDRAQRDEALAVTADTFAKSGALLRVLAGQGRDRAARVTNRVAVRDGLLVAVEPSAYARARQPWDV